MNKTVTLKCEMCPETTGIDAYKGFNLCNACRSTVKGWWTHYCLTRKVNPHYPCKTFPDNLHPLEWMSGAQLKKFEDELQRCK